MRGNENLELVHGRSFLKSDLQNLDGPPIPVDIAAAVIRSERVPHPFVPNVTAVLVRRAPVSTPGHRWRGVAVMQCRQAVMHGRAAARNIDPIPILSWDRGAL